MIRIYTCTHKAFTPPPDPIYVPILCGAALPGREESGMPAALRDDGGENISLQNPFYSELTGMYWAWKNDREADILGLCHYRRYLLDSKRKLFTEGTITAALSEYDVITTRKVLLDTPYREAFGGRHDPRDLSLLEEAVSVCSPGYTETFRKVAGGRETYFGNMLICRRELFDAYSGWLFPLLSEVEKKVDMTGYNDYQKRLYGFLSELLLMVYLCRNGLRVLECDVAVMGGKKETQEVLAMIARYFREGDPDGAARCYMEMYRRRPDILMEASDVDGKLKIVTQMLATFQAEREQTGHCYLEKERDPGVLLKQFRELNEALADGRSADGIRTRLSGTAVRIAEILQKNRRGNHDIRSEKI